MRTMSDDLTDLPNVGPKTAENLRKAGFTSYDDITDSNPRMLAIKVDGVGEKGAMKIYEAAGGEITRIKSKTNEERIQDKYGETLAEIEQTPAAELEQEILDPFGEKSFITGVEERPDDTVFVPTQPETAQSPFRVTVEGPRKRSVEKIHEDRSERAQDVDEQQNAPITTDEEKWIENKNRYDYPGVDTVPRSRQRARAENAARVAQDQGALDRIEQKGQAKTLGGKFSPPGANVYGKEDAVARVQETADQPERTLAHEVAHAFDYAAGDGDREWGLQEELFDEDPRRAIVGREFDDDTDPLIQQAYQLSERARKGGKGSYRRKPEELTADAVSQAILNPRATKREAPELFDRIEEKADEYGFAEAIPDPLATDPEPVGFLNTE